VALSRARLPATRRLQKTNAWQEQQRATTPEMGFYLVTTTTCKNMFAVKRYLKSYFAIDLFSNDHFIYLYIIACLWHKRPFPPSHCRRVCVEVCLMSKLKAWQRRLQMPWDSISKPDAETSFIIAYIIFLIENSKMMLSGTCVLSACVQRMGH
jgi:hypothetical protein